MAALTAKPHHLPPSVCAPPLGAYADAPLASRTSGAGSRVQEGGWARAATVDGPEREKEAAYAAQVPPEPPPALRAAGPHQLLTEEDAVIGRVGLAALIRAVQGHGAAQHGPCAHWPWRAASDDNPRAPAPARAQQLQQRAHGALRFARSSSPARPLAGAPYRP